MYVCSRVVRRHFTERLVACVSRRNLSYGPTRAITSKIFEKFHQNQQQQWDQFRITPAYTLTAGPFASRFYSRKPPSNTNDKPQSAANDSSGDDDDTLPPVNWSDSDWSDDEFFADARKTDLALPNAVPDIFPKVPLIALKYPIFPKFSKIIAVSDPKLIQRLEWSVASSTPYAGVFVLKDTESDATEVTDLSQVYPVGTFIKIGEMERRGDKMHLIVTGHRRIKITRAITKEPVYKWPNSPKLKDNGNASKPEAESRNILEGPKPFARSRATEKVADNDAAKNDYVNVGRPSNPPPSEKEETETPKTDGPPTIIMVETENMKIGEVDKESTEYKAITLEIVSTIRQIITENTFIQEAVKQMLGENLNVADNPAYLADLATAITSARPEEQQKVLEEEDVSHNRCDQFSRQLITRL